MHDTSEPSVMELVVDQLEELVVTLIEEVRERPGVAVAILAGVAGAIVGAVLAARGNKRHSAPERLARGARGVADTGELVGLGVRLLQNPIVRGMVMRAVEGQLKKRMPR